MEQTSNLHHVQGAEGAEGVMSCDDSPYPSDARSIWAAGEWTVPFVGAGPTRWVPGLDASRIPYNFRQSDRVAATQPKHETSFPRSVRNLREEKLARGQLEALTTALGTDVNGAPPYPSAGALYPVHLFAFELVDMVRSNVIYMDNAECRVFDIGEVATDKVGLAVFEPWCWPVGALLAFVIDLRRVGGKYGTRGIRFATIEVGLVAQIVRSTAYRLGLASCLIGGYADLDVLKLLALDSRYFGVACLMAIGSEGAG